MKMMVKSMGGSELGVTTDVKGGERYGLQIWGAGL